MKYKAFFIIYDIVNFFLQFDVPLILNQVKFHPNTLKYELTPF